MKPNFISTMQATLIKPDLTKRCHSTKHFCCARHYCAKLLRKTKKDYFSR